MGVGPRESWQWRYQALDRKAGNGHQNVFCPRCGAKIWRREDPETVGPGSRKMKTTVGQDGDRITVRSEDLSSVFDRRSWMSAADQISILHEFVHRYRELVTQLEEFVRNSTCDCHDECNKPRPQQCDRCRLLGLDPSA